MNGATDLSTNENRPTWCMTVTDFLIPRRPSGHGKELTSIFMYLISTHVLNPVQIYTSPHGFPGIQELDDETVSWLHKDPPVLSDDLLLKCVI